MKIDLLRRYRNANSDLGRILVKMTPFFLIVGRHLWIAVKFIIEFAFFQFSDKWIDRHYDHWVKDFDDHTQPPPK